MNSVIANKLTVGNGLNIIGRQIVALPDKIPRTAVAVAMLEQVVELQTPACNW